MDFCDLKAFMRASKICMGAKAPSVYPEKVHLKLLPNKKKIEHVHNIL